MNAHAIVDRLLETTDPDDPQSFLQSHPGFTFRSTMHMGDMVFVVGPGEDRSDWPEDIGRVVEGPDNKWYVIGVRGVPDEHLAEHGFGLVGPQVRKFDTKDDAALAIWLVRSRMPLKKSVLAKRRPYRVREAEDEVSDEDIQRYLDAVKVKPGLRRYSREQIMRYLAQRPPAQPEPPGEPHQIVRESVEQELVAASKKIKHCGDYGKLFYHPGKHEVHWTAGDSDGVGEYTPTDEIIKLLKLPGIKHVEIGDEWSPDEAEGWKRLDEAKEARAL